MIITLQFTIPTYRALHEPLVYEIDTYQDTAKCFLMVDDNIIN